MLCLVLLLGIFSPAKGWLFLDVPVPTPGGGGGNKFVGYTGGFKEQIKLLPQVYLKEKTTWSLRWYKCISKEHTTQQPFDKSKWGVTSLGPHSPITLRRVTSQFEQNDYGVWEVSMVLPDGRERWFKCCPSNLCTKNKGDLEKILKFLKEDKDGPELVGPNYNVLEKIEKKEYFQPITEMSPKVKAEFRRLYPAAAAAASGGRRRCMEARDQADCLDRLLRSARLDPDEL